MTQDPSGQAAPALKPIHGRLLALTGLIHSAVTFLPLLYGSEWLEMARAGFLNALPIEPRDHPREAAFWFFIAGPVLIAAGDLLHHVERREGLIPARFLWSLLAVAVVGSVIMPASGFTVLLLPQLLYALWRQRRARMLSR